MRVPLSWLQEFVDLVVPLDTLVERLTLAGLEVSAVEHVGADWPRDKLLVGQVLEVKPHPQADRLVLAVVDIGRGAPLTAVTGAPNLRPGDRGQKVAVACEGAELWDGTSAVPRRMTLRRARIRGVESVAMLCSEKELGLSDDHSEVLLLDPEAPVGRPLQDVLGETVLEVELTPNLARAHCVVGLAREVAALTGQRLRGWPPPDPLAAGPHQARTSFVTVHSADPQLCPRYSAALIENVRLGPSPLWLRQRLRLSGMRPINNVVDITNYCMLETGQPLHAFDYETLQLRQGIVVRPAAAGERLRTLDGVERVLAEGMLLITDDRGPIALAGIMGGEDTEVTARTRHVLLESANFHFLSIRRTAQRLRLTTEAGQRFGRGVDSTLTVPALLRAARLMERLAGGRLHPEIADTYPLPPAPKTIALRPAEVRRLLGMDFAVAELQRLLEALEFRCTPRHDTEGAYLDVEVPSYRLDVSIPADLVEEVARLHGYDAIPETLLRDVLPPQRSQPLLEGVERTRDILVGCGLTEVISYSLTSLETVRRSVVDAATVDAAAYLRLANPISQEREVLRRSLLPSLLETLRTNSRFRKRLLFFEIGRVYEPQPGEELPREPRRLGIALSGPLLPPSWHYHGESPEQLGYTHLKGIVETLCQRLNVPEVRFVPASHPSLLPGRTAALELGGQRLGILGELHPQVRERFDLPDQPVALLELDLEQLLAHRQPRRYQRLSRFPAVLEDMALVVDAEVPAQAVADAIRTAGGELLRQVTLFDLYTGDPIPPGKKSLAFSLVFQADDRSLSEDEVRVLYRRIQQHAAATLGAQPRQ
ncbi:MAG: phenylalanine--tRNA ligase beta subunit [Candidatus Tectimicrobiota bacterium]|nr:MAG: phenylalanine--tRNA ligase beta subunit [Candidatus Tectomicrobia bacterium]